ncbi:hypothetical protein DY000_02041395 [Brassica cretica]|uniref:CRA domain-containing protein n=1 Tax=Brassica cretica TaxID=69181 RepID=A0ABQ7BEZ4_BRACR|nr:hypothetical protein DY000_02041395 [Brassica cretica]
MKSSEFRRPFPTEFRRNMVRRNFPTTFRRHSDKKCNRCSRRKFVGIFRRISDDILINSKVVGIPTNEVRRNAPRNTLRRKCPSNVLRRYVVFPMNSGLVYPHRNIVGTFLQELEKTVALLVFEDASNCHVKDLLDISHRLKTASEVNAAILTCQSHEKDPKLPSLLKMLIWAQNQLDEKPVYPHINDLSTGQLEDPPE